jgi:hypothetical protein
MGQQTFQEQETSPAVASYKPVRDRFRSYWLMLAIVTIAVGVFARVIYSLPLAAYVQDLNVDDSFYYYLIAHHFAIGHFSTADGIHLTNGYHPLWVWLLIPVFKGVQDPITAMRVVKMEELALLFGAACFCMAAGRLAGWRAWALAIIPLCFFGRTMFFLGLEAAAQVAMLAILLFLLTRLFMHPGRWALYLAIAMNCAFMPWVRLECVTVSMATGAAIAAYMLWRREFRLDRILCVWTATGIGAAFYLIYNKVVFGTAVPVSGQVKAYWSQLQFARSGGYSFWLNAERFLRHDSRSVEATFVCLIIVLISWSIPTYRRRKYAANHGIDAFVVILASAHVARMLFSILSLDVSYDVDWYYVPAYFLMALLVPLAVSRAFVLWRLTASGFNQRTRRLESYVACAALVLVAFSSNPLKDLGRWRGGWRGTWGAASFEGTEWMNNYLPDGAVIGSSDSGIVGYFSKHQVINLDGLVNAAGFLTAVRGQSVESWMRAQGIQYLGNAMGTNESGCSFMARASAQPVPYTSPCVLIYEGTVSWNDSWNGVSSPMRFRVLSREALQQTVSPSPVNTRSLLVSGEGSKH